jgi:hypothetical protein
MNVCGPAFVVLCPSPSYWCAGLQRRFHKGRFRVRDVHGRHHG